MIPFISLLALSLPLVGASSIEPCSVVSNYIKKWEIKNSTLPLYIPGQTAEECLKSIPFYPKTASKFIDELTKYIQWQSTLEALKNPPDTYTSDAVDLMAGLEKIRKTEYSSQWAFDQAINALFTSAHDDHLFVRLCSVGIFSFMPGDREPLVSVSKDGISKPEIYTLSDSLLLNNTRTKVSPVVSINGENADTYLGRVANMSATSQDPDARYNSVFFNNARLANELSGGSYLNSNVYVNATTYEFRNGSTVTLQNVAEVKDTSFQPKNGKDIYDLYCRPESASNSSERSLKRRSKPQPLTRRSSSSGPAGYPNAPFHDPFFQMNGYYLDDDTMVMLIPSFSTDDDHPSTSPLRISHEAETIVRKAQKDGRKIIIDVTNNGGGNVDRAYNLFKLFFPDKFPYSATTFRRHEVSEALAKTFSVVNDTFVGNEVDPFGYNIQVTPDQKGDFKSYQDYLGNKIELGTPVSSLAAVYNYTMWSDDSIPIRGYGGLPLLKKQPFKAEDILIVSDGICASTCHLFVTLMTNHGGVRSLSIGGRPNGKPMQVLGGVRGGQAFTFEKISNITRSATAVMEESPEKFKKLFPQSEMERFASMSPIPLKDFPIAISDGGVNFRNSYMEGNDDLPLQFAYQAADCRLYYTLENILHPETVWQSAKQAIWGNGTCIKGSTGGAGSLGDKNKNKYTEEKGKVNGAKGLNVGRAGLGMVAAVMVFWL
ncbi:Peptidase S41 [Fusarium austroafricanum]|uniref:Peptidase S41 n=1 Tax=Fusarium austroafricanum TaxID=2364996 RepID=A0A8H4KGT9_9HYPO|nr:Peptidase S41 [Fusarium austroafricanum]